MTIINLLTKAKFSTGPVHPLLKVLFYGSDSFSLQSLKLLNNNRLCKTSHPRAIESLEVVCTKLKGPVTDYAIREDLPLREWPYHVPPNTYSLGIVASFGHMIPSRDIEACQYGMINVHPSLLPRWRGAAPLVHTLLAGDTETGVSIITVAPKRFDTGKILMQQRVPVPPAVNFKDFCSMMGDISAQLLVTCMQDLPALLAGATPQSEEGVTKAPKVTKSMGVIHWSTHSCDYLHRLYGAVGHYVDLTTSWQGNRVKLYDMINPLELSNAKVDELVSMKHRLPGYCYYHPRRRILCVRCHDGWVAFRTVSIKGHRKMTATEFDCGFVKKVHVDQRYFQT